MAAKRLKTQNDRQKTHNLPHFIVYYTIFSPCMTDFAILVILCADMNNLRNSIMYGLDPHIQNGHQRAQKTKWPPKTHTLPCFIVYYTI